jgi:FixJ family two-component response regulator
MLCVARWNPGGPKRCKRYGDLLLWRRDLSKETEGPLIWIVDSEHWPRAALRAELIERGYLAVGYVSLSESLAKLRAAAAQARPRSIILELRGQELTRESLQELERSSIPTIILGGIVEMNDPTIQDVKWTAALKRPVRLGEIADMIERTVPQQRH